MRRLGAACLVATMVAASEDCLAFECSPVIRAGVDTGLTQGWNQRCLPFWVFEGDPILGSDERQALVVQSFSRWIQSSCTDFELIFRGTTTARAGFDNRNSENQQNVVLTALSESDLGPAGPAVVAIALNSFSPTTGEIFDSDIILNGLAHRFDVVEDEDACNAQAADQRPFDIENTLVHEVGHFFGFDHVRLLEATMFESAEPCETNKRTLEADDLAGMCAVYPVDAPVSTCSPPAAYESGGAVENFRDQCIPSDDDGCGCRSTTSPSGPWLALLGLGLAGGFVRRVHSQRSPSRPASSNQNIL